MHRYIIAFDNSLCNNKSELDAWDHIIELTYILFESCQNLGNTGFLVFNETINLYIKPSSSKKISKQIINRLLMLKPSEHQSNLAGLCEFIKRTQPKSTVLLIISDSTTFENINSMFNNLLNLSKMSKLIIIRVVDTRLSNLPNVGIIKLQNSKSKETFLLDSSNTFIRDAYSKMYLDLESRFQKESLTYVNELTKKSINDLILTVPVNRNINDVVKDFVYHINKIM